MDRWTDIPAAETPEPQPSRFRRGLDRIREGLSGQGAAAAILIRGGIAIGLVALAATGAMIQNRSAHPPSPQVKTPNFTTLPTVRREPGAVRNPPSASRTVPPLFSTEASLPMGQGFLPRTPPGPAAFCEDLASFGFPGARWEPSQVFAGEWECAAPLKVQTEGQEPDEGGAFLVARGRREDAIGNLMLRLNPASEDERRDLAALAGRLEGAFASETGLMLPEEASGLLKDWSAGEITGLGGRMRLVANPAKPESRIVNLSVTPRFAVSVDQACRETCFAGMRGLAKAAKIRKVKSLLR